jgi:hypothetical protein
VSRYGVQFEAETCRRLHLRGVRMSASPGVADIIYAPAGSIFADSVVPAALLSQVTPRNPVTVEKENEARGSSDPPALLVGVCCLGLIVDLVAGMRNPPPHARD